MIFLTVLLAAVLFLLLALRVSADLVAVFIVLALIFSGTLTVEETFAGFGSPVVVAIAALFIVSGGLYHAGVAGLIGRQLARFGGKGELRTLVIVMAVGALLSSVITNVAATAILLPAVITLSLRSKTAPSRLLLPLSYATILGGTLTLVGSQPNIIASSALEAAEGRHLGFFALTPVGLLLTVLGIGFMALVGIRLLPVRQRDDKARCAESLENLASIYRLDERLFELTVRAEAPLAGKTLSESELGQRFGINVIAIVRPAQPSFCPSCGDLIRAGDRLIVQGREGDVEAAARDFGLDLFRRDNLFPEEILSRGIGVAEVVLPPRSPYVGKKLGDIQMRERLGLTALAIWRGGKPIRARLGEETLQFGDALLVRGPWARIRQIASSEEFILVSGTEVVERQEPRGKMLLAGAVLAAMVVSVVSGALTLPMAALGAAALMVVTRCLGPADAYRAIEWRMIIMIGGFLSLGTAMVKTGLIEAFVGAAFAPLSQAGGVFVLAAIFLLSTAIALVTSNITAAVLLAPVAVQAASSFGLDPGTLLICVVLGASNGFMSPVAQQANLLVMGPGNYVTRDYIRAGLGLSLLVFAVSLVYLSLLRGL